MIYSTENTRTLAKLYNVGNCLKPYRDVAKANSGNCSQTLTGEVIDSDSVKNVLRLNGKSVDVVLVTEKGRIVFAEMKMGVTSKNTCQSQASQVKGKITNSRSALSGQGTFSKYEYAYVLLSNNGKNFNQLKSIFLKVLRPSRKSIGAIEVLKESEFEREFFE